MSFLEDLRNQQRECQDEKHSWRLVDTWMGSPNIEWYKCWACESEKRVAGDDVRILHRLHPGPKPAPCDWPSIAPTTPSVAA